MGFTQPCRPGVVGKLQVVQCGGCAAPEEMPLCFERRLVQLVTPLQRCHALTVEARRCLELRSTLGDSPNCKERLAHSFKPPCGRRRFEAQAKPAEDAFPWVSAPCLAHFLIEEARLQLHQRRKGHQLGGSDPVTRCVYVETQSIQDPC